jgi:hypothetical protein
MHPQAGLQHGTDRLIVLHQQQPKHQLSLSVPVAAPATWPTPGVRCNGGLYELDGVAIVDGVLDAERDAGVDPEFPRK